MDTDIPCLCSATAAFLCWWDRHAAGKVGGGVGWKGSSQESCDMALEGLASPHPLPTPFVRLDMVWWLVVHSPCLFLFCTCGRTGRQEKPVSMAAKKKENKEGDKEGNDVAGRQYLHVC